VEAGIADTNVGAVGAQQRERARFPAGLLQNLAAGGFGRFFTRVDPAGRELPAPAVGDEPVSPQQQHSALVVEYGGRGGLAMASRVS